jgi:hypothetical protein
MKLKIQNFRYETLDVGCFIMLDDIKFYLYPYHKGSNQWTHESERFVGEFVVTTGGVNHNNIEYLVNNNMLFTINIKGDDNGYEVDIDNYKL